MRADPLRADRERASTERAILELSGERGYANVTIAELLARADSNRSRFYSSWSGKEECFASAYCRAADDLQDRLLTAGGASADWDSGVTAAFVELATFTAEAPSLAAGLIGEVKTVGGAALEKRAEVFDRLARALDRGRRGLDDLEQPPPATAAFVLHAAEASILRSLAGRGRLGEDLRGLLLLALAYYRGLPDARRTAARLSGNAWP